MISNKVMKLSDYEKTVVYRASCDCESKDCDMYLDLEADKESDMIFLSIHKDVSWSSYWGTSNWFQDKWNRIKVSLRILFTGHIRLEESFIFRGEDHINSFIEALNEGKEKIKNE